MLKSYTIYWFYCILLGNLIEVEYILIGYEAKGMLRPLAFHCLPQMNDLKLEFNGTRTQEN